VLPAPVCDENATPLNWQTPIGCRRRGLVERMKEPFAQMAENRSWKLFPAQPSLLRRQKLE
jgi:hypothetical protein